MMAEATERRIETDDEKRQRRLAMTWGQRDPEWGVYGFDWVWNTDHPAFNSTNPLVSDAIRRICRTQEN